MQIVTISNESQTHMAIKIRLDVKLNILIFINIDNFYRHKLPELLKSHLNKV